MRALQVGATRRHVPIDGHVCGLGRVRHREFAMGAGEMSKAQFIRFLTTTLEATADAATTAHPVRLYGLAPSR